MDVAIRHDHGCEFQFDTELTELDGDGGKALSRLNDGERKLTTGQEAGFFSVDGDQVWLGQNLQKIFLLQRLNHRSEIDVGAKQKQIQRLIEINSGIGAGAGAGAGSAAGAGVSRLKPAELPRGGGTCRICRSVAEQVYPELRYGGTVNLSKLDLQYNFLRAH